jgi:hypothetical protein
VSGLPAEEVRLMERNLNPVIQTMIPLLNYLYRVFDRILVGKHSFHRLIIFPKRTGPWFRQVTDQWIRGAHSNH